MNKTARACFTAKGVYGMLEKNYRTLCAEEGRVSALQLDLFLPPIPLVCSLQSRHCSLPPCGQRRRRKDRYGTTTIIIPTLEPRPISYSRAPTNDQIVPDEFEIKAKVEEILTESTHSDSRAAKMSIDDILQWAFILLLLLLLLFLSISSPPYYLYFIFTLIISFMEQR